MEKGSICFPSNLPSQKEQKPNYETGGPLKNKKGVREK